MTNDYRPPCINHGCERPVTFSRKNHNGTRRWRPYCDPCHRASYGERAYTPGVRPFKLDHCEYPGCTSTIRISAQLELDHIDGDRCNNTPANIQTLCKNCHALKGKISGDYRRRRVWSVD